MRYAMTASVLAAMLFATVPATRAQISIGVSIGPPPPARVVLVQPERPDPEFVWIEGYWYPVGRHYKWHEGYWTRPPYEGARWVGPHHDGQLYFAGYWEGDRGRIGHDHHWDHDHDRDFHGHDHDRDHNRDHGHDHDQNHGRE
jgi:hypothetical protein